MNRCRRIIRAPSLVIVVEFVSDGMANAIGCILNSTHNEILKPVKIWRRAPGAVWVLTAAATVAACQPQMVSPYCRSRSFYSNDN
ncbi:hypothetical protein RRG08_058065 [Elysia crispata]|uniref:Uncharacterized protein n=1 Tax=Elysia crispata TaxID=231223 RepID=A0AAE1ACF9_9GAST|nr:hypothetical protein RRG08_058065 [Elysia crispata]